MQWSQRYFREGGTSAAIRTMLIQSQYLSGDFAGAAKELTAEIQAAERAGSRAARGSPEAAAQRGRQAERQQRLRVRDGEAGHLLPEEGVLGRPAEPPAAQARLLATGSRSTPIGCRSPPAACRRRPTTWRWRSSRCRPTWPSEGKQVVDKGFSSGALGTGAAGRARTSACRSWSTRGSPRKPASRAEDERQAAAAKSGDALVTLGMKPRLRRPGRQGRAADAAGHRQGRPQAPRGRQAAPRHRPARRRRQGEGAGHASRPCRAPTAPPTWRASGRCTRGAARRSSQRRQRAPSRRRPRTGPAPPSRREGSEAGREQPCPAPRRDRLAPTSARGESRRRGESPRRSACRW